MNNNYNVQGQQLKARNLKLFNNKAYKNNEIGHYKNKQFACVSTEISFYKKCFKIFAIH